MIRRWKNSLLYCLTGPDRWSYRGLLAIWLFSIITGLIGIDFGVHWDEIPNQITPLKSAVQAYSLLPHRYNYPSVFFWVELISLIPFLPSAMIAPTGGVIYFSQLIESHGFLLYERAVFLILSSLAIPWTFLAIKKIRSSSVEALFAAAFLGFSWEVNYHMRWIAPDTLLMQFGSATLLACMLYWRTPEKRYWLWASAVFAGLAMGSKYPGGIFLLLVVTTYFLRRNGHWLKLDWLLTLAQIGVVFVITFCISTPGFLFDNQRFYSDVMTEIRHYSTWHYFYTVTPGLPHLYKILQYLTGALFSPFRPVAWVIFLLALSGIYSWIRQNIRLAIILLCVPVAYIAYMSTQRVLIVRNLMLVSPFLAIFAARGVYFLIELADKVWIKTTLKALTGMLLAANAGWLLFAALSIPYTTPQVAIRQTWHYVQNHPEQNFLISPRLADDFQKESLDLPANSTLESGPSISRVLIYSTEGKETETEWPVNDPFLTLLTFGPREMNFNYYSTWIGLDHILLMDIQKACSTGLDAFPNLAGLSQVCP